MKCFFIKEPKIKPPCFVLLGRYGDLIQLFPAFKAVRDRTGQRPVLIVSADYASVCEGVSYVQPVAINASWWEGVPVAKRLADEHYGGGLVLQWWNDPATIVENPGGMILQSHGREWGVDLARWPDYGTSMWDRAGFTREEMKSLPLVFDRRNYQRELELYNSVKGKNNKPMLLLNFRGESSPFAPYPEVMGVLNNYGSTFHIVDLATIRGERIYDLLGLYDRAVASVQIDSAPLHLAAASEKPYAAFTVDGWTSSVPKRNCQLEIKYSQATQRLAELNGWLQTIKQKLT